MGVFDKVQQETDDKGGANALKDKAQQMAGSSGVGNAADQGLEKAGQTLDDKTGNKYSDQVGNGVNKAKDVAGQKLGQPDAPADGNGQAQQPDQPTQPADPSRQADPNQASDPNQQVDPNQQMDPNQAADPNQPPQGS
jgi:hypothetical protein